jgi:hypothetical protein
MPCTKIATIVRRLFGLVLTKSTHREVKFSCSGHISAAANVSGHN